MVQKSPRDVSSKADEKPAKARRCEPEIRITPKARLATLASLDGRTVSARRARDLIEAIEADLGGDLTEGERQLVMRAAVLGALVEDCEARWLGGQNVDLGSYLAAVNVQRRVLATIGLERRARDVTPSLEQYARQCGEAAE
jgi:hypothetical protein